MPCGHDGAVVGILEGGAAKVNDRDGAGFGHLAAVPEWQKWKRSVCLASFARLLALDGNQISQVCWGREGRGAWLQSTNARCGAGNYAKQSKRIPENAEKDHIQLLTPRRSKRRKSMQAAHLDDVEPTTLLSPDSSRMFSGFRSVCTSRCSCM